jgi:hypothetical protein
MIQAGKPKSVELRAIEVVTRYYKEDGYEVENVTRVRGKHYGYDLVVQKNSTQLKVEVKGCTKLYQIPDSYSTQFDKATRQLIADFLCVVCFQDPQNPQLAIIPREAILPEYVIPKYGYRISGKFKNAKMMGRFLKKGRDVS